MPKCGKFVASIEARCGSSRLPGKVMKEIIGRPMLELMIERVKKAKEVDEVVLATTVNPKDDVLETLAKRMGIACYRGSEEDVLLRVLKAVRSVQGDHIVELWGDTPLIDPEIIDRAVEYYKNNDYDLVGTKGFPWGMSLLVFPSSVLEEVNVVALEQVHRENVSTYIYWHPEKYSLSDLQAPHNLSRPEIRLTVDELPDFQLVSNIFEHFGKKNIYFNTEAIIQYLDAHPEVKALNKDVKQRVCNPEEQK